MFISACVHMCTHIFEKLFSCSFLQTAGRALALATAQACKCHWFPHYFLPLLCTGLSFALCRSPPSLSLKQKPLQSWCTLSIHYFMIRLSSKVPHFYQVMESYGAILQVIHLLYIIKLLSTVWFYVFVLFLLKLLFNSVQNWSWTQIVRLSSHVN